MALSRIVDYASLTDRALCRGWIRFFPACSAWSRLFSGHGTYPLTNTLWAAVGSPILALFIVWAVVVLLFRRYASSE